MHRDNQQAERQALEVDPAELGSPEWLVHQVVADKHHEAVDSGHILEEAHHMVGIRDSHTALECLEVEDTLDTRLGEDIQASSQGREVGLREVRLVEMGADLEELLGWQREAAGLEGPQEVVDAGLLEDLLAVAGILLVVHLRTEGNLMVLLGVAGTAQEEVHRAVGSSRDSSLEEVGNNHQEEHQGVVGKEIVQEDW